jgi:hypothetical protein
LLPTQRMFFFFFLYIYEWKVKTVMYGSSCFQDNLIIVQLPTITVL